MDDLNSNNGVCFSKDITEQGKTVTVYVRLITGCGWELNIIGKANQVTTWSEWFTTAIEAMDEGLAAILREGIDEFYSNPVFAYSG